MWLRPLAPVGCILYSVYLCTNISVIISSGRAQQNGVVISSVFRSSGESAAMTGMTGSLVTPPFAAGTAPALGGPAGAAILAEGCDMLEEGFIHKGNGVEPCNLSAKAILKNMLENVLYDARI